MHQKLAPDPFIILLNTPKQPLHVNFFFSNPVSFNGQNYQKQSGSGTSDQSLFRLQNKLKSIPLFVIYYLTKFDDVM